MQMTGMHYHLWIYDSRYGFSGFRYRITQGNTLGYGGQIGSHSINIKYIMAAAASGLEADPYIVEEG